MAWRTAWSATERVGKSALPIVRISRTVRMRLSRAVPREASHALRKLSFDLHCPVSTGELWVACHDDDKRTPLNRRMRVCETCHATVQQSMWGPDGPTEQDTGLLFEGTSWNAARRTSQ